MGLVLPTALSLRILDPLGLQKGDFISRNPTTLLLTRNWDPKLLSPLSGRPFHPLWALVNHLLTLDFTSDRTGGTASACPPLVSFMPFALFIFLSFSDATGNGWLDYGQLLMACFGFLGNVFSRHMCD